MKDITKQKFGLLTVLEYVEPAKSRGRHRWKCQCDCGTITIVQDNHLISGNTKSCGCLHRRTREQHHSWKGHGEISRDFYSNIRRSAAGGGILKRKKKEFNVSIEYLWDLFLKQRRKCAISGVNIGFEGSWIENKHNNTSRLTASLDRIDSTKGYVEGNVQWVHKVVNIMKNNLPMEEFKKWCRIITENSLTIAQDLLHSPREN